MTKGPAPLAGVRVLDFSRVLAGPHCGRMLVDLGADVVKVEPPEGDMTRFGVPRVNSISTSFVQQNCGKRNISLDLGLPEARDVVRRLSTSVDVVLENFRPGVMKRLGLGYDDLRVDNPRIVFASITGYGQQGVWSGRRAYAPLVAAEAGLLEGFARYRRIEVAQEVFSHADFYAALECLSAILAALYVRDQTGEGQCVEVSMAETLLCINEYAAAALSGFGPEDQPELPATVASPVFRTRTGALLTVGGDPTARDNFDQYCRALGRPELADDPRFADGRDRRRHRADLHDIIQEWVLGFEAVEEIDAALHDVGFAVGVVRSVGELGSSEWATERGAVVEVDDRGGGHLRIPNSPWRFSSSDSGVRGMAAYRGEHNREVLREWAGCDADELDALDASGVLSSRGPSGK